MKFSATGLEGAFVVQPEPARDNRGYFARLWCQERFAEQGIDMQLAQMSVSHNDEAGTLRGMHFQWPPSNEGKLVRCEHGRIFDVIIDLRPDSPTFTRHFGVELDARSLDALYVPPGFAHGFQTLEPGSDVLYLMSDVYDSTLADGVRYSDPAFAISWPLSVSVILPRDRDYPDFDAVAFSRRYSENLRETDPGS